MLKGIGQGAVLGLSAGINFGMWRAIHCPDNTTPQSLFWSTVVIATIGGITTGASVVTVVDICRSLSGRVTDESK